jgi:hypothetical protein
MSERLRIDCSHIAADGLDAWTAQRVTAMQSRIRTELRGEGIDEAGLDAASQQVETAIQQLLGDDRGRWLFASDHIDARSGGRSPASMAMRSCTSSSTYVRRRRRPLDRRFQNRHARGRGQRSLPRSRTDSL